MKVKEFKQKLINYARELIPPGYTDYIRIPGSASTENMNIITTKKDVVRKFFSSEFEQESFAVQFSKNDQVPGLKTIESFEVPLEDNDKEVTDLFPGISEEEFLEEEKQKTKYNFELVMNSQNVSIRKLLDHIEKNQYMGQDISTKDLNHLWDDFLNKWPVERLESMSLNEYTNLNRSDSFCYWLEKKTESLASIWGGSAYKFGIYKRDNLEKEDTRKGYKTDGEYAWVLKFGPDRDSAFQNVRKRVYEVARLAQAGEIEKIDDIDLGHSFKWKIAALYHKNLPFIMKKDAIDYLAEDIGIDTSQPYWVKYNELSNANPGKDILDYSSDLWEKYFKSTQAEAEETEYEKKWSSPLNQIFYGPPGTGKTYHTIDESVKIVEELSDDAFEDKYGNDRKTLKKAYQSYINEKQIGFCTFHQSFSYEDFIEGIKPVSPKEEDQFLKYKIQPGIFKIMAQKAQTYESYQVKESEGVINLSKKEFEKATFYKMSLGDSTDPEDDDIYKYCIENNCIALGYGERVDFSGLESSKDIALKAKENGLTGISDRFVSYLAVYMKEGDYVIISHGNTAVRAIGKITGKYFFNPDSEIRYSQFRPVKWIIKDVNIPVNKFYKKLFSQQTVYKLSKADIIPEFFEPKTQQTLEKEEKELKRNHVLIIDEINRGNISQIFGELITLIESDKRKGRDEELSATLPYSKEEFTVPPNLYIIGTMNTADRSIEALDTALRRRFTFKEMESKPELIKNLTLRLIAYLHAKYIEKDWTDPEWKEVEDDLKRLFIKPDQYDEVKEEFDDKFIQNRVISGELDYDEMAEFYKEKDIEYLDFERLLIEVNKRIEKLLDKDHCIGHAYFLTLLKKEKPFTELRLIFENKILPLLQEYFYGDFGKVGLVLGEDFVELEDGKDKEFSFAKFDAYDNDIKTDLKERKVFKFKEPGTWTIESFIKIYK